MFDRYLTFSPSLRIAVIVVATLAWTPFTGADDSSKADPSSTPAPKWAIAIHGGAGGVPAGWTEEMRSLRLDGMSSGLAIGREILAAGGTSLDAVEAVIMSLEENPVFNAGRGAVLTKSGRAELDASIMDGRDRSCGAVAGVTTVKHPISLSRLVMTQTPHVLLAARGAEAFAKDQNVPLVDPDYFLSRNDVPASDAAELHYGTVGCVALDTHGNLAAGTSTGGTSKKLSGRVGDSPIVGAGTFADNATCAVSGTGKGEEYIRNAVAYDVSAQMSYAGRSLDEAIQVIMTERLESGVGGLIGVSHNGDISLRHNTPGMTCGAANSTGRFDTYLQTP